MVGAPGRDRTSTVFPPPDFELDCRCRLALSAIFSHWQEALESTLFRRPTLSAAFSRWGFGADSVMTRDAQWRREWRKTAGSQTSRSAPLTLLSGRTPVSSCGIGS